MSRDALLAIETATHDGSVALLRGDGAPIERRLTLERRHSADLLPTIDALLREHGLGPRDLGAVAYSAGPGSFTGLRVAATVATMLQEVIGCDVVAVSTLEALAVGALPQPAGTVIVSVLDAARDRVYFAAFRACDSAGGSAAVETLTSPEVRPLTAAFDGLERGFVATGPALRRHAAICASAGGKTAAEEVWRPRAAVVAELGRAAWRNGQVCSPHEITPHYLRPPECEEVYEQRRAEALARRSAANPGAGGE